MHGETGKNIHSFRTDTKFVTNIGKFFVIIY
jgi:hypothetical protein